MNKYFLHIFLGFGLIVLLFVITRAYQFDRMSMYAKNETIRINTHADIPMGGDAPDRMGSPDTLVPPVGKIKADVFAGKLEKVDTGCFADGECFIVVDGKHVTALRGWSQDTVGSVQGVDGFGDLEKYIGKNVEVYAQVNPDDTYTLYGSEGFYIKPVSLKSDGVVVTPKPTGGCVIGGCSSQLCVDEKEGPTMSTCEYRESYACYTTATCERQASGQCGWTKTPELTQCLMEKNDSSNIQLVQ